MGQKAVGRFQKAYLDSADSETTPTWGEMKLVRDGDFSVQPQTEDVTTRKDGRQSADESYGYQVEANFSFRVPKDATSVTEYVTLRDRAISGEPVHLRLSDGIVDGGEQGIGWFIVSSFEKGAPIDGFVTVDVSVRGTSGNDGSNDFTNFGFSANPA